jgi:hypothetical protein
MSDLIGGEELYLKFDEGTGTTAADSSGNGNTCTLVNTPTWVSPPGNPIAFSNASCLRFNGSNQRGNVPHSTSISIANTLSISLWCKFVTTPSGFRSLFAKRLSTTNYGMNTNGSVFQWYYQTATFRVHSIAFSNFTVGSWAHIVGRFTQSGSNTISDIFVGGSLINSTTLADNVPTNTEPLAIAHYNVGEHANIELDDFRLFARTLTTGEISLLAAGGPSGAIQSRRRRDLGGFGL